MRFLKSNWFLLGILTALVLGFLLPGAAPVLNPRSITRTTLIVALFLISGVNLPTEAIGRGLKDYPLHIFTQLFIFAVTPAYFVLTTLALKRWLGGDVQVGIFALACLPTTISSCIIFTQISGGNVVGTMFNASLANAAGIFLSPLLLSLLLSSTQRPLLLSEAAQIFRDLALMMLLPIVVGQLVRRLAGAPAARPKRVLSVLASVFMLFIIFFSFAKSAAEPRFLGTLRGMLLPFGYLAVSFLMLLGLAYLGARLLGFSRENVISVLYTAPQKTLALGIPLLTTYFASAPELLTVAILPLLFYHPWQLLISGFIRSSRLVRRGAAS